MPDPVAPRPGHSRVPAQRLYRAGPWLVGHDGHPPAARFAREVHDECERRDVAVDVDDLESLLRNRSVGHYPGLIMITKLEQSTMAPLGLELRQSLKVAGSYRACRPHGLPDLHAGRVSWHQAGVAQVVGYREVLMRPEWQEVLDLTCRHHYADALSPADLFDVYEAPERPVDRPGEDFEVVEKVQLDALWQRVLPWGLKNPEQVELVLTEIECCRRELRSGSKPALSRPVPESSMSRLDYVLEMPNFKLPNSTTWTDDGGRVVRETIAKLQECFPWLHSPCQTKGAQSRFRDFYRNLRRLALALKLLPRRQWPDSAAR